MFGLSAITALVGGAKNAVYILAGLAIAGMIAGFWWWVHDLQAQASRAAVLATQLDTVTEINDRNRKTLAAIEEERTRQEAIAAAARQDSAAAARRLDAIKLEIAHAKPSDNGPVAPVLRRVLERLRDDAAASRGDGDPAGPAAGRPVAGGMP